VLTLIGAKNIEMRGFDDFEVRMVAAARRSLRAHDRFRLEATVQSVSVSLSHCAK
jgi:hypothetical protein